MFGLNRLMAADTGDGSRLWVQELFPTIQGEGPLTGSPALFLRLGGCNLRCHFCDTDFESSTWQPTLDELMQRIEDEPINTSLVVLTGGEPLRQNVVPLITRLMRSGYRVQIETAGTVWPEGLEREIIPWPSRRLTIVCSPKTGKVHPMVEAHCRDFKYILRVDDERSAEDDLPVASTQVVGQRQKLYRARCPSMVWVQPCEEYAFHVVHGPHGNVARTPGMVDREKTQANVQLCINVALRRGYRLSMQVHKLLGLP